MPRGGIPDYRRRKEPVLDEHLRASVGAGDMDETTGHYPQLIYAGITSKERAQEIKRALYRSGKHVGVSVHAEIECPVPGKYQVRYRAINKAHARKFILERYGPDRSAWPYDPRRRNSE